MSNPDADPLFKESIFRLFTVVNRVQSLLESGELRIDFVTYERLLEQIIHSNKIPYHGEPVVGLQIMGLLETRNLDFDHLLVLGCNEGNVPKTSDNPSFIPYLLREAFELTTPVHQDSVYAYHFYRMLQRAKDVTLVYGNVTDNTNRGERSRFMSQLLVESGKHITQKILQTNEESVVRTRTMVEKDAEIQARLNHLHRLSPSALNKYMRCELLFYYSYILGIRDKDDNLDGEIDNKLFGSIFHDASEFMYDTLTGTDRTAIDEDHPFAGPGKPVKREMLEWALKKESGVIDKALTEAFENDLFGGPRKEGGQREYNGLQLLNRQVIRHYLEKLLSLDLKTPSLSIRGLEGNAFMDFPFEANGEKLVKEIGGRIDRLDETEAPGNQERCIRVVDYKTGAKLPNIKNLEEVFSSDAVENHSDYFFQVMLYSMIVSQSEEINPHHLPVCPALLFIQKASEKDYTPIISFSTSEGKKSSNLDEAVSKVFFYNIMFDIEKLALAQYLAELAIQVIPEGAGDPEYLSLMLNSLHLLHNSKKHELIIKAVFELRLMSLSGFMPDIVGCRGCGLYEDDVVYFDTENSCIWCKSCVGNNSVLEVNKNVLNAVRTALLADPKKIFSFSLGQQDTYLLADLAEIYTLKITDRCFKTLDYYKKIKYSLNNKASEPENGYEKTEENNNTQENDDLT